MSLKIVTGGQTGVDLAAFEFALAHNLPCGGWVPKGRTNEAGRIPGKFRGLRETESEDVSVRTRLNVQDSDALLVFQQRASSPGTQLTIEFAAETQKPHLVVDVRDGPNHCAEQVRSWLLSHTPRVLNISGPRNSEAPGIGARVREVLELTGLANCKQHK